MALIPRPMRAYKRARKAFSVFNKLRIRRQARKAKKRGESLTPEQVIILIEDKPIVKDFIVNKAKAAVKSTTVGFAGALVGIGVWAQANPEVLAALVPEGYEGVTLAAVGLVVALFRMRTAGK